MITLDGNGIAAAIGAGAAAVVSLGTFSMQVISWLDQRKLKVAQDELKRLSINRDAQIKEVKDLVNGKSEQLQAYVAKDAYEKGREHERVAPGTPSPALAVTPLNTVATAVENTDPATAVEQKADDVG